MNDSRYFRYNSRWGEMLAQINESGALKGLWFTGQKHFPTIIPREIEWIADVKCFNSVRKLEAELKAYENGTTDQFTIALEPDGTPFQKEVWHILMQIPYGTTITYGEISQKLAERRNLKSMSSQAVGQAIGRNPISIIIPCHRVLGKDGSLTGYAGGLERKTALLDLERKNIKDL